MTAKREMNSIASLPGTKSSAIQLVSGSVPRSAGILPHEHFEFVLFESPQRLGANIAGRGQRGETLQGGPLFRGADHEHPVVGSGRPVLGFDPDTGSSRGGPEGGGTLRRFFEIPGALFSKADQGKIPNHIFSLANLEVLTVLCVRQSSQPLLPVQGCTDFALFLSFFVSGRTRQIHVTNKLCKAFRNRGAADKYVCH